MASFSFFLVCIKTSLWMHVCTYFVSKYCIKDYIISVEIYERRLYWLLYMLINIMHENVDIQFSVHVKRLKNQIKMYIICISDWPLN